MTKRNTFSLGLLPVIAAAAMVQVAGMGSADAQEVERPTIHLPGVEARSMGGIEEAGRLLDEARGRMDRVFDMVGAYEALSDAPACSRETPVIAIPEEITREVTTLLTEAAEGIVAAHQQIPAGGALKEVPFSSGSGAVGLEARRLDALLAITQLTSSWDKARRIMEASRDLPELAERCDRMTETGRAASRALLEGGDGGPLFKPVTRLCGCGACIAPRWRGCKYCCAHN